MSMSKKDQKNNNNNKRSSTVIMWYHLIANLIAKGTVKCINIILLLDT